MGVGVLDGFEAHTPAEIRRSLKLHRNFQQRTSRHLQKMETQQFRVSQPRQRIGLPGGAGGEGEETESQVAQGVPLLRRMVQSLVAGSRPHTLPAGLERESDKLVDLFESHITSIVAEPLQEELR